MTAGRALSVLVHAPSKVGKSTLGNTAPAPRLILDAEMGSRFLPGAKCYWDPMREEPPRLGQGRYYSDRPDVYSYDWETCVVLLRDYQTMTRAYDWLNQMPHPFESAFIDSITEIQTRCKDALTDGSGSMDRDKWGALLIDMERLIRGFRDLTEHPVHPLSAVIMSAMTHQEDGKWRPYVQGQLKIKMPYFLDVIGYLDVGQKPIEEPTQEPEQIRQLLVEPHPMFEAGNRVQGRLPAIVDEPTITGMITKVFGPEQELSAA